MMPLLVVLSLAEMASGMVLEDLKEVYVTYPTLLVLVPVMIGMGGNLGAILSSRLSTALHLGTLDFRWDDRVIRTNVVAISMLAATAFVALGFLAYGLSTLPYVDVGGGMSLGDTLSISVVSGGLLTVLVVALSLTATYVSYRLGVDPDDTTIPVVTNGCDILGVVVLSGVAMAVL
ncbi:MAG: magnesium transporter [Halobacteriales archaeon]